MNIKNNLDDNKKTEPETNDLIFKCNLSDFDGPLDVLLTLIQQKKMDIQNLDVVALANQYNEFIKNASDDIDVDSFSEYTLMAAYLIELKARSLLPNHGDININMKDFEKERQNLIQRLLEYKMYKDTLPLLEEYKLRRSQMYEKNPEDYDDYFLDEIPMGKLPRKISVEKLKVIFEQVVKISVEKSMIFKKIDMPEVSITDVQKDLVAFIEQNKNCLHLFAYFQQLSPLKKNVEYFCTLFLAMLVLIKRQWLFLENDLGELSPQEFYLVLNDNRTLEDFDDLDLSHENDQNQI